MTSGMMMPTESVVIANIANMRYVSVLTTAMLRDVVAAGVMPVPPRMRAMPHRSWTVLRDSST